VVKTTFPRAVSEIVTGSPKISLVVTGFKGERSRRQSTVKRARGWIRVNFREFAQQLSPLAPLSLSVHTCTYERDTASIRVDIEKLIAHLRVAASLRVTHKMRLRNNLVQHLSLSVRMRARKVLSRDTKKLIKFARNARYNAPWAV